MQFKKKERGCNGTKRKHPYGDGGKEDKIKYPLFLYLQYCHAYKEGGSKLIKGKGKERKVERDKKRNKMDMNKLTIYYFFLTK